MAAKLRLAQAQSVQIDWLWLGLTLVAFLIFAYLPTYVDSDPGAGD